MNTKTVSTGMRITQFLHRLVFTMDREADTILSGRAGIGFSQFLVLMVLKQHPDTTQVFASQCLNLTPGALSRQTEILVQKKIVERKENPANRREHILSLTAKGNEILDSSVQLLEKEVQTLFAVLNKEEIQQLEALLERVTKHITNTN